MYPGFVSPKIHLPSKHLITFVALEVHLPTVHGHVLLQFAIVDKRSIAFAAFGWAFR